MDNGKIDEELQRFKDYWKRIDPSFDLKEIEKLWGSFSNSSKTPRSPDSVQRGSSWKLVEIHENFFSSQSFQDYKMTLLIFVPLFIFGVIVYKWYQEVLKPRRPVPAVSRRRRVVGSIQNPQQRRYWISSTLATVYVTPSENNRHHGPSRDLRVDEDESPLSSNAEMRHGRNMRRVPSCRSTPRIRDTKLPPSDNPPAYSTVVSSDLAGEPLKFPLVSLRNSTETPPPSYEEHAKHNS